MNLSFDVERILLAHKALRAELLAERAHNGHWVGQMADSPLATAAAISALVASHRSSTEYSLQDDATGDGQIIEQLVQGDLSELLLESVHWLARHQNADGGWGDCDTSHSNLAATMTVQAAFRMTGVPAKYADLIVRAEEYIESEGGAAALRRNYPENKSLIAAILANCALAGTVPWRQVPTLAFELVCIPKRWRSYIQLTYPRHAIPALLAAGNMKVHHDAPRNPFTKLLRRSLRRRSLTLLDKLQAADNSFLNSVPLTSFVVTSLASIGCQDHSIVQRGIEYLLASVRSDASWPSQSDQAVTNTSLALLSLSTNQGSCARRPCLNPKVRDKEVSESDTAQASDTLIDGLTFRLSESSSNGSGGAASDGQLADVERCAEWLLQTQRTESDRLTRVPAGGWAATDAPGALPSTVATADALLALARCHACVDTSWQIRLESAARLGIQWLLDRQYGDGGWPTYYNQPGEFLWEDSGPDVIAAAMRALGAWQWTERLSHPAGLGQRIALAIQRGWEKLGGLQQLDGRFIPLWFGNEFQPVSHNPVIGTSQVLIACAELNQLHTDLACNAAQWLVLAQHANGGWGPPRARRDYSGADKDAYRAWQSNEVMSRHCSVEETAIAVTALLPLVDSGQKIHDSLSSGLAWLASAIEQDAHRRPAVVGFSLSRIWYHERLYPLVFAAGAFAQAIHQFAPRSHEVAASS